MLEEFYRRKRFFGGDNFREKCVSGIIKAARTRFHSHVQQGMKEWAQTNDMDSDTDSGSEKNDISEENSQDIASRQDFIHFEKFFAGLNYASVGLLNDILPLSRCFPPWYDVASKLINVHISCVIAVVAACLRPL